MNNQQAYNAWASQYDTNANKTRDLEAVALRSTLGNIKFDNVLELGCGTGKNSSWFHQQSKQVTAVDFSHEMLAKARQKINSEQVHFIQADLTQPWDFTQQKFQLISFSLVLEHIENLDFIFSEAQNKIETNGYLYIGELHPFKQYSGSLARFQNNEDERVELQCFTHHISEFLSIAYSNNFTLLHVNEWFDDGDTNALPRILTLLFQFK